MARERRVESAIEVALLAAATAAHGEFTDDAQRRLLDGLREQGIEPGAITSIADPDVSGLRAQLAAVLTGGGRPDAEDAAPLPPIALLAADVVVNATALGAVLDDPRVDNGALGFPAGASMDPADVDRRFLHLGVLKVAGPDRATVAALAAALPVDPDRRGDLLLDLTRAMTAAGIDVRPVPLGGYAWARPASAEQVTAAVAAAEAVDERTVRLREAARGGDGFYSTFVLRRVSWRFTGMAERVGLTPNQVTLMSFALGLVAAGLLALGSRPWSIVGALLLQFCLVVDCVDGELARYRRRFSRFGAWLDATTDRVKEFAAIGALAVAAARSDQNLWGLVAAAIAVQTFRNLLDLGWDLQRAVAAGPQAPPAAPEWVASATWLRPPLAVPAGAGPLSWARRVGHFPIGERFLLISLGAAFWSPRGTLITLLVVGLLSAAYMLAAFALRSRPATGSGLRMAGLLDAGPVLGVALQRSIGARAGRAAAIVPAAVGVAELALLWWLAVEVAGAAPAAGATLVAAAAIAHYQHAYGVREDVAPGLETAGFVIGSDLRLVLMVLAVVFPTLLLTSAQAQSWADTSVWGLALLVLISSTFRSLQAWIAPGSASGPGSAPGRGAGPSPAGAGDPAVSSGQNEVSVDRMQTGNADPGNSGPRQAIGGVR